MKRKAIAVVVAGFGLFSPWVLRAQSGAPAGPTFSNDVAPIFYKSCTSCHRPGEIAPMSLLTFADSRPYARAIATQVSAGTMPPWHADPAHGVFANDRSLSAAEKDTILKWVSAGTPEGNPANLPPAPVYPGGWNIGRPDAVFELAEDYTVPASGTLDYKHFEVPTNFTEDKWIQAFEVKPGNPAVVHHIIVYARAPRPAPRPAAAASATSGSTSSPSSSSPAPAAPAQRPQPPFSFAPGMNVPPAVREAQAHQTTPNDRPVPPGGLGAFVGDYAPGQAVRIYAPGSAMRLPAGSTLIFQLHYTANGKPATDRSRIAFVFAKTPPRQEAITVSLINQNFTLPAGAPNTKVDAQMTFNQDVTLWSLLPHTHVRGRQWNIEATYPDGRTEVLLSVPKYDFNWQTDYVFKQPLKLPKGTILRSSAWYDNSPANKSNPDPTMDVHWGEQTWEEMQFMALTITLDPAAAASGQQ